MSQQLWRGFKNILNLINFNLFLSNTALLSRQFIRRLLELFNFFRCYDSVLVIKSTNRYDQSSDRCLQMGIELFLMLQLSMIKQGTPN